MFHYTDGLATEPAAPNQRCTLDGRSEMGAPTPDLTQPVTMLTWLERYDVLRAENAVLSDGFDKGTLTPQQFAQLQGNIDQMALLFAVYREAGFPDRNLPIEGNSPKP